MTRARSNPEHMLQRSVREFLVYCLPADVLWTASMTGQNLSVMDRGRQKAAGVRRGWPDISLCCPDGITRFIELKSASGSLTPEQREFRDHCAPFGIFAVCRSVDEVEAALRGWGIALRAHPFRSEAYNG